MRFLCVFAAFAALCAAGPKTEARTEIGELNGAKFRIDVPENWNGGLVMYCHGYSADMVSYKESKLSPVLAVFTDQGFAVAQSGYAAGGWAMSSDWMPQDIIHSWTGWPAW